MLQSAFKPLTIRQCDFVEFRHSLDEWNSSPLRSKNRSDDRLTTFLVELSDSWRFVR